MKRKVLAMTICTAMAASQLSVTSAATNVNGNQNQSNTNNSSAVTNVTTSAGVSVTTSAAANNNVQQGNWRFTRFGVTTSEENNTITTDDVNKTVTLTSGRADGTNAGGKVTGSNDGISYYYTEIDPSQNFELSANVNVNFFEKAKPDKQCAFGIMARDQLGVDNDISTAPSNMVLVGGYRANVQSVYRSGVTSNLDGKITMNGEHKFADRPANDGTASYKLTLKKTNTGYICSVDNGSEVTYYEPKLLEVAESGKIYVGFFTARIASITVSDINLTTSDASKDPAGVPKPPETIVPELNVKSTQNTADTNYNLKLQPTVEGNVNVKLNGNQIYDAKADSSSELSIPATLNAGDNKFDIVYTPEVTANNNNTAPITKTFNVNVKAYGVEKGEIYVSPNGSASGDGTIDNPIDIYSAVKYTNNGQTIKVKGGTYNLKSPITIENTNSGSKDVMKSLEAYDGRAIFDFGKVSKGFFLNGNYWNVKGIDVTNTLDANAGLRVAGSYNVLENIKTYKNGDTGFQVSSVSTDDPKELWPSYNQIINCDSYDNMDAAMNNADGFAAKLTCGDGNVFRGCIAHNNCDDGWDLFSKLEIGKIGAVRIENCIAYGNGTLTDGTVTKGDGNGFKLGGEGLPVKHTLLNSLSFNNDAAGITGNSNPACVVKNSISADNEKNYSLDYYTTAKLDYELENTKSFYNKQNGAEDYIPDFVKGETNYFYNGTDSENIKGEKLDASMFKSTVMPSKIERDENNNIIWPDYMALVNSADSGTNHDKDDNTGDNNQSSGNNQSNSHSHGSHHDRVSADDDKDEDDDDIKEDQNTTDTKKDEQTNDSAVKHGWHQNLDKTWSFINSKGEKIKGWIKEGLHWYYLNESGIMHRGWFKDNNSSWYYLNENGCMHTGWLYDGNGWYYLNENGSMRTGWLQDSNGKWYYLSVSGAMHTGWLKDSDGKWYYLNESGDMAADTSINGYTLGINGAWIF